jgi:hypothetical protein
MELSAMLAANNSSEDIAASLQTCAIVVDDCATAIRPA